MATHLVTGGTGFLGNLISTRLLLQGEKVKIIDVCEDKLQNKEVEFIHCDVRDRTKVARVLKNVDFVHHNAALVPLTKSGKLFWDVNVNGSKVIAEESAKSGIKYFIHMSSSAIFGLPESCPITSQTNLNPVEIYGRSKLAGEKAIQGICSKYQLPLVIVRPRTLLGKGRLGIFQILFEWISDSKNIYLIGDGNIKFQFLHAADLMDFYMIAVKKGIPGVYNIGTNQFGTLREVLQNLISYASSKSKIIGLPVNLTIATLKMLDFMNLSPLAPWHYLTYHKDFYFDVSPLLKLGWMPKYSNDKMFKESYDWFIKHKEKLKEFNNLSPHRRSIKQKLLKILKAIA